MSAPSEYSQTLTEINLLCRILGEGRPDIFPADAFLYVYNGVGASLSELVAARESLEVLAKQGLKDVDSSPKKQRFISMAICSLSSLRAIEDAHDAMPSSSSIFDRLPDVYFVEKLSANDVMVKEALQRHGLPCCVVRSGRKN